MTPLLVALAGGLGAGSRFVLDGWLTERGSRRLPVATLTINVVGSFLLGALTVWSVRVGAFDVRAVAGVGYLGGFTTFSTASVEAVRLVRAERPRAAVVLALGMLLLAVCAALAGAAVGTLLPAG